MGTLRIIMLVATTGLLSILGTKDNSDPRYEIIGTPVCWNTGGIDSNLIRYDLVSTRSSSPIDIMYVNPEGQEVSVGATPSLQHGWCCDCTGTSSPGTGSNDNIYTVSDSIQDTRRRVAMELNFDDPNEQFLSFGEFVAETELDMLLNLAKTYYDNRGLYILPGIMGFTEAYAGGSFQHDIVMGENVGGVLLQSIDDSQGGEGEIFVESNKVALFHTRTGFSGDNSFQLISNQGALFDQDSSEVRFRGDGAQFILQNHPNTRDDAGTTSVSNFMYTDGSGELLSAAQAYGLDTLATSATSVTVTHGLGRIPDNVTVTPLGNLGAWWVTSITSTQFTLNVSTGPASDIEFQYNVK